MTYAIVYLMGVLCMAYYCYRNLDGPEYGEYFVPAVVVTSVIWPLMVVVFAIVLVFKLLETAGEGR